MSHNKLQYLGGSATGNIFASEWSHSLHKPVEISKVVLNTVYHDQYCGNNSYVLLDSIDYTRRLIDLVANKMLATEGTVERFFERYRVEQFTQFEGIEEVFEKRITRILNNTTFETFEIELDNDPWYGTTLTLTLIYTSIDDLDALNEKHWEDLLIHPNKFRTIPLAFKPNFNASINKIKKEK